VAESQNWASKVGQHVVGGTVLLLLGATFTYFLFPVVSEQWNSGSRQMVLQGIVGKPETCAHVTHVPAAAFDNMAPISPASYKVYQIAVDEPAWGLCAPIGNECKASQSEKRDYCVVFNGATCRATRALDFASPDSIPGLVPTCK
jgi:hypothetical protein